jgi:hypothetical protein
VELGRKTKTKPMSAVEPTGVNEGEVEPDRVNEGTAERDAADPGRMSLPEGEAHEPRVWPNPSSVEPPRRDGIEDRGTRRGRPDRAESLPTRSRGGIQPEAGPNSSPEAGNREPSNPAEQRQRPEVEGLGRETGAMARDYPPAGDERWRWQPAAEGYASSELTEAPLELGGGDERPGASRPVDQAQGPSDGAQDEFPGQPHRARPETNAAQTDAATWWPLSPEVAERRPQPAELGERPASEPAGDSAERWPGQPQSYPARNPERPTFGEWTRGMREEEERAASRAWAEEIGRRQRTEGRRQRTEPYNSSEPPCHINI